MASSQIERPGETLQSLVVRYALLLKLIDRESNDLARRLQSKLAAEREPGRPRLRVHVDKRPDSAGLRLGRVWCSRSATIAMAQHGRTPKRAIVGEGRATATSACSALSEPVGSGVVLEDSGMTVC